MKKIFCLLLLIIFISFSTAYAGERPKEFRGLYWGTHISKVEGLVPKKEPLFANLPRDLSEKIKETMRESEERGEKTYLRTSDILTVPGGEVKTIEYVFIKDRLAQVNIIFDDYDQYFNFVKICARLYGPPDKEEIDERMNKQDWYTKKDDEADVTLFYSFLIKAGFVTMKCKAFLKRETGLILGDDRKMEASGANWQLFREDDEGKWFFDNDKLMQPGEDILQIRVKCNLSIKRQNAWRTSLKSKIMPRYTVSLEEIRCSSKETRNLQLEILSEKGPLRLFQKSKNWESIAPDSIAEVLYNKVCK
jgi:hypothetical protein